jgi:hypothetical protein
MIAEDWLMIFLAVAAVVPAVCLIRTARRVGRPLRLGEMPGVLFGACADTAERILYWLADHAHAAARAFTSARLAYRETLATSDLRPAAMDEELDRLVRGRPADNT